MVFKHTAISLGLIMACANSTSVFAEEFEKNSEVIVVTGSRIDQKLSDVAGSVNVVTEQDIAAELAVDLSTAFRFQTGINATGSAGQAQALNIRGMGGNRVVYVKDGRRLNDAYQGGNGLLVGRGYLDIEGVKQIEVAKGAASSLYGSDALGGIVVISGKTPEDYLNSQAQFASIQMGFNGLSDETSLTGAFAKRFGDNATSIVLTRRDGKETQNFNEDLPEFDYDSNAVVLKSQQRMNQTDTLLATVDFFEQKTAQMIAVGTQETVDENTNLSFSVGFKSTASTSIYDNLDAQVYITDFEQKSAQVRAGNGRTGPYVDHNDYRFEQQILGAKLVLDKKLVTAGIDQQLVYGFDFERYDTTRPRFKTRLDATGQSEFDKQPQKAFPGADTDMLGVFVQSNIALVDELLELQLAVRWDHFDMQAKDSPLYGGADFKDIDETAFSPKIGLIYSLNDNMRAYVQYAEGFKIPPHDQAYQSHGVEPFYQILPNTALEPEYSQGVELGLKGDFENHQFTLSAFNTQFDGFIASKLVRSEPTFIPRVNKSYYQYQNLSDVEIKGVEASYTMWLNERFAIDAGITYLDGKDTTTDKYIDSISPLNGYIKARYDIGELSLTAAVRAAQHMDKVADEQMAQTSGWGTLDLFAQYQIGNWQLHGGVFNMLDKEYISYQDVAGQNKEVNFNQYTQPGRYFAAKLKYIF
ncbi:Heme/hemopexin utilization protein C [Pseudoalteromonas sp. CIP111854]|uniref:Heme/hemopexin utilization protein C n=1 Tax=Pseudoalteromonas holothuriae TaxID=2963714 RepID=A0A9W4VMK6_9GAMM|nr:TonB-dependent receptor [Pseudoalteromonas sp. CIP111854]CAH9050412.1 Heme/hemopexin utilization protein C [Pseudoalteromonas sp. CIP111854]